MQETIRRVLKQNEEIEIFSNDDPLKIAQMILNESQELVEAVEMAFLNDDLTEVASECADVLYLLIRMFNLIGLDEKAIHIKIDRNYDKYLGQPDSKTAKEEWAKKGGDRVWFDNYLDK